MGNDNFDLLFDSTVCRALLPPEKTDNFFDALFGDATEGSYDIEMTYGGCAGDHLQFNILLHERPGHCLACNLTQGLPEVFTRHPIIDVAGIVEKVDEMLGPQGKASDWKLGATQQKSQSLHLIPLIIELT